MRTIVYVDGLNLYYRLLRSAPRWKWLNLKRLAEAALSSANVVVAVRYYTARVSGRFDPHAPARQQVYLDALATVPEISVHMGNFLVAERWAELVHPPQTLPPVNFAPPFPDVVKVWKIEEKGSDVNLAAHLLSDAFRGKFDVAAVLTNDTDLVEPIRIARHELGLPVGLLSPVGRPAASLSAVASFVRRIGPHHLNQAQFADPVPGTNLHRPASWN